MNEEKTKKLIENLLTKQISYKSYDGTMSKTELVHREGKLILEQIIRQFLLEGRDEEKGVMEAKLFAYEQIISKSNFAPLIVGGGDKRKQYEFKTKNLKL